MPIFQYLFFSNYPTIIILFLMSVFLILDKTFPAKIIHYFAYAIILISALLICDCVNCYYRPYDHPVYLRTVFATFGYILRPFCIGIALLISLRNVEKSFRKMLFPAFFNAAVAILNLWFPVIFYINEKNQICHSFLWFIPYVSSLIIFVEIIISAIKKFYSDKTEAIFVFIFIFTLLIATYCESQDIAYMLLPANGVIGMLFYFLKMNADLYKRDTLTHLYNRNNYNQDLKKFSRHDMIIVSMDLNNLKLLNDSKGHQEGDNALTTTTTLMKECFSKIGVVYRTGGDEFMALFPKQELETVVRQIKLFQEKISKTKYRVAIGYAVYKKTDNLDEVIAISDLRMYSNKKQLKADAKLF